VMEVWSGGRERACDALERRRGSALDQHVHELACCGLTGEVDGVPSSRSRARAMIGRRSGL